MKTPEEIKLGLKNREPDELMADALELVEQLEAELEQVKAERDRYWQYIKGLGCDTCGGDCDRCEVGLDRVWSGWVWAGEKEEVENV